MSALTIAMTVLAVTLAVLFFYGHQVLKKRKEQLEDIGRREGREIKEVSYVSYHGGLPALPKPQKLTVALSEGCLFLVTDKGEKGRLPMDTWIKVEKFTTLRKHDVKQRSMILWGPFNNVMFKDQIRHFVVINYRGQGDEHPDNNLLIEHGNKDQRDAIFKEINESWEHYRRSASGRHQGSAAVSDVPALS